MRTKMQNTNELTRQELLARIARCEQEAAKCEASFADESMVGACRKGCTQGHADWLSEALYYSEQLEALEQKEAA